MKVFVLFMIFLLNSCTEVVKLPYKEGRCYRQELKFMAKSSNEKYEIYKVKKKSRDGYELGRYHNSTMFHYTKVSVENVKKRVWEEVECPDKKDLIMFK